MAKKKARQIETEESLKQQVGRKGGKRTKRLMTKKDPDYYSKISKMRKTFGAGPGRPKSKKADGVHNGS